MPATNVTTTITAATLITTPSKVSAERNLLPHSDCRAIRMASRKVMRLFELLFDAKDTAKDPGTFQERSKISLPPTPTEAPGPPAPPRSSTLHPIEPPPSP